MNSVAKQFSTPGDPAKTEQAIADWNSVRGSLSADTFLAGLLIYNNIQS